MITALQDFLLSLYLISISSFFFFLIYMSYSSSSASKLFEYPGSRSHRMSYEFFRATLHFHATQLF